MAKKSLIAREKKRQKLALRHLKTRISLKTKLHEVILNDSSTQIDEKYILSAKLQKLPLNSSLSRLHNRCFISGRPKGYYRFFGLSRHFLREMAHDGLLPGVKKASW
jgi:small subunit ribosomal protein S14